MFGKFLARLRIWRELVVSFVPVRLWQLPKVVKVARGKAERRSGECYDRVVVPFRVTNPERARHAGLVSPWKELGILT